MATERRYMLIGQGARKDKDQTISGEWDFTSRLRFYDSGETDYAEFSHDGTDFNTEFTNTTAWNISGVDDVELQGGIDLDLQDNGRLILRGNVTGDFALFQHDGTDFDTTFNQTTDWNVSGITAFRVGDAHLEFESGRSRFKGYSENSVADEATVTFTGPDGQGGGMVLVYDASDPDAAVLFMTVSTTTTSIHTGTQASLGGSSNPNVDGNLNVWKSSAAVVSVKNRLGSSRNIRCYWFSV